MNMFHKNLDSIIFDLDGTLWNPSNIILKAWNEVISTNHQVTKSIDIQELESLFGMQHNLIAKKVFPDLDSALADKIMNECFEYENTAIIKYGGNLYKDVENVLSYLSNKFDLYIVSNCQSGYIESFFSYHKLEKFFKDFECSGNTGKPKDENIKSVIIRNNLKNTIYIGDTIGDLKAAELNNIPFIFANYGFGDVKNCKYSIDVLTDLYEIF